MKKLLVFGAIALLPATGFAQDMSDRGPSINDWEVTLSGTGSSDREFDTNIFGISGSLGKYFTDNVLAGVRQSVSWADIGEADDIVQGSTRAFAQYNFDLDAFRPFIGANLGGIYGDNVNTEFFAGLEGGLKYYADANTFVYAQTEYQFTFDDAGDAGNGFEAGGFVHQVGIGFNF